MIRKDSIKAKYLRFVNPSLSYCKHCGLPWNHCESRSVEYSNGRGCFAVCTDCWKECSLEELKGYYTDIFNNWSKQGHSNKGEIEIINKAVERDFNNSKD